MHEIIVYGGAFNPPHAGHVDVIRQLSGKGKRVLVVPSYRHAFGKEMAPFAVRMNWLQLIARRLKREGLPVEVDGCERELAIVSNEPVYSWTLLNYIAMRERLSTQEVAFVVGEDNQGALSRFHRADELLEAFPLVVAKEQIALHSTTIREALKNGDVVEKGWLPPGISIRNYMYFAAGR